MIPAQPAHLIKSRFNSESLLINMHFMRRLMWLSLVNALCIILDQPVVFFKEMSTVKKIESSYSENSSVDAGDVLWDQYLIRAICILEIPWVVTPSSWKHGERSKFTAVVTVIVHVDAQNRTTPFISLMCAVRIRDFEFYFSPIDHLLTRNVFYISVVNLHYSIS